MNHFIAIVAFIAVVGPTGGCTAGLPARSFEDEHPWPLLVFERTLLDEPYSDFIDFCGHSSFFTKNYINDHRDEPAGKALIALLTASADLDREARDGMFNEENEKYSSVLKEYRAIRDEPSEAETKAVDAIDAAGVERREIVESEVVERVQEMKRKLGDELSRSSIEGACEQLNADLLPVINNMLPELKVQMDMSQSPVTVSELPCIMSQRVLKANRVCKILKAAPVAFDALGIH